MPYAVEREVEDIQALIDAAGGSALVHGFSSGAVLALLAAARGLAISRLALLEPPLPLDPRSPEESDLGAEVAALVAGGRRGDAVEHFQRSIGVPEEYLVGMREQPWWPAMEALAHTLVYDTLITGTFPLDRLPEIATPTLIIDSEGTDDQLRRWADGAAAALPNGSRLTLPGEWHGVAPEILGPAMVAFFIGR